MSYMRLALNAFTVGVIFILLSITSLAQSTLTDDAHTNTAPKALDTNFGSKAYLTVSAAGNVYIKFRVSSTLPTNTPGMNVAKATLRVYIGDINNPGQVGHLSSRRALG